VIGERGVDVMNAHRGASWREERDAEPAPVLDTKSVEPTVAG